MQQHRLDKTKKIALHHKAELERREREIKAQQQYQFISTADGNNPAQEHSNSSSNDSNGVELPHDSSAAENLNGSLSVNASLNVKKQRISAKRKVSNPLL
jgi:hypothetical protein